MTPSNGSWPRSASTSAPARLRRRPSRCPPRSSPCARDGRPSTSRKVPGPFMRKNDGVLERPDEGRPPSVRISDDDRQQTVEVLRAHCTDGRLTLDEFSDRV